MMKNSFLFSSLIRLAIVCLVVLPLVAARAEEQADTLSRADKAFITEAYAGGLAEIKLGELAQTKATNPEAKALGERLVSEHRKANEELEQLAKAKEVTLPTEPSPAAQAAYKSIETKEGAEFDKAFAQHTGKHHKKEIAKFEKIAKETRDAELKSFIEKTLPVLKEHQALAKSVKGDKK